MTSFWRIFWLELIAMIRSKALAMLTVASLGWMFAMPYVVKGDGTAAGAREVFIRYSLGGVFALLTVTLLASAAGSLARERTAKRLQLTMVRPVRYATIVLGKVAAMVAVGAGVLALAMLVFASRVDLAAGCNHVLRPLLPTPREEALAVYDEYMADPHTPASVKSARKAVVLRLLENRAKDHYQPIATNSTASWRIPARVAGADDVRVRLRFCTDYNMRQDVIGTLRMGNLAAAVSNITQAVISVPMKRTGDLPAAAGELELSFANRGKHSLMLRPRKDLEVLLPADAAWRNVLRAYLEMVAVLALVIAFGVFLSSALGRPVALFVAIVSLILCEMSPSVVEQYPDELETKAVDRVGLMMARAVATATHPVSSLTPLEALANDDCIEPREVVQVLAVNCLLLPVLFAILSALAMPRKQDEL